VWCTAVYCCHCLFHVTARQSQARTWRSACVVYSSLLLSLCIPCNCQTVPSQSLEICMCGVQQFIVVIVYSMLLPDSPKSEPGDLHVWCTAVYCCHCLFHVTARRSQAPAWRSACVVYSSLLLSLFIPCNCQTFPSPSLEICMYGVQQFIVVIVYSMLLPDGPKPEPGDLHVWCTAVYWTSDVCPRPLAYCALQQNVSSSL